MEFGLGGKCRSGAPPADSQGSSSARVAYGAGVKRNIAQGTRGECRAHEGVAGARCIDGGDGGCRDLKGACPTCEHCAFAAECQDSIFDPCRDQG